MRLIADLYRVLLLLVCALAVVTVAILALDAHRNREAMDVMAVGLAVVGGIGLILVLAITATVVWIHDRHGELVAAANRIAEAIEACRIRAADVVEAGSDRDGEEG